LPGHLLVKVFLQQSCCLLLVNLRCENCVFQLWLRVDDVMLTSEVDEQQTAALLQADLDKELTEQVLLSKTWLPHFNTFSLH
jgi:alpha-D-ribose 1-methylphosphonate 5-triphosphate synthase subunit PhnI